MALQLTLIDFRDDAKPRREQRGLTVEPIHMASKRSKYDGKVRFEVNGEEAYIDKAMIPRLIVKLAQHLQD